MTKRKLPTISSEGDLHSQMDNDSEMDATIPAVSTATTHTEDTTAENTDTANSFSNEEDQAAAMEAASHRQHAQTIVREHLQNHAQHNPGASSDYVTWIATLHPENADITIDQRFFVPGNPWWTIYEDTKNTQIPLATAVPVSPTAETEKDDHDLEEGKTNTTKPSDPAKQSKPQTGPHCCLTCNPIALIAAMALTLPAILVVVCLELLALVVLHFPANIFYKCGQAFAPPNICTCVLYFVFMTLYCCMSLADSMLLLASVILTECLGVVAAVVGFLTGGCVWATNVHQSLRRVCHGIRVRFRRDPKPKRRRKGKPSVPPRSLCCCRRTNASLERERKADRAKSVRVVNVQRVRRPAESFH